MTRKDYHYGLRYQSGETLEETISLLKLEIKEVSEHMKYLEKHFPDYPTIPTTRGAIRYYKRMLRWLEELKKFREAENE